MSHRISAVEAGTAAGTIAAAAAQALHGAYPHLSLESLVATFTSEAAVNAIAFHYSAGLAIGSTPVDAAKDTGNWLIHKWAEARLAT